MNTKLYNLVIDSYAKAGDMSDMPDLIQMMEQDGCRPDSFTASLLIKGHCYAGQIKTALAIFEEMRGSYGKPDVVAFNTLLDGCIRCKQFHLADHLVNNIEEWGVEPTNCTLGTIVKMWGRRKQLDKCFEAATTMTSKYGFAANAPTTNCLFTACVLNGEPDRAFAVLKLIKRGGMLLDARACGSMLHLLLRLARLDDAVWLTREAAGGLTTIRDVDPNAFSELGVALQDAQRWKEVGVPLFLLLKSKRVKMMGWVERALREA
jgi:pentatricopeptide repeat protein